MKNSDFVERLIEICGTSLPRGVSRKLGISYQSANLYLKGRMPGSNSLIDISRKTSCSIHWLLTGEGEKYIEIPQKKDKPPLTDQMREFIRQECLEVINEVLRGGYKHAAAQKVVFLNSKNIKEEKIAEKKAVIDSVK